jgi:hypothetical protein
MARTILLLTVLLLGSLRLALLAQPAMAPSPASKALPQFAPGWQIALYQAPTDVKALPVDPLGTFVDTTGAPYAFDLYKQRDELKWFKGTPAYRFAGWLEVKQPGRHTVIVELLTPRIEGKGPAEYFIPQLPTYACRVLLQMEQETLVDHALEVRFNKQEDPKDPVQTVLPSGVELEPGFYQVALWATCQAKLQHEANQASKWQFRFDPTKVQLTLRLKRPADAVAQPVTPADLLHQVSTGKAS